MVRPGASPYKTHDPRHHALEIGRIDPGDVHEFYGPFAMVPDVVEVVRVASPGYGEMDFIVLLEPRPVTVYCGTDSGERFLRQRFPRARRLRVPQGDLFLEDFDRNRALAAELRSSRGPVRELALLVRARPDAEYEPERYESHGVWESSLACHGIDMRVAATARGILRGAGGRARAVSGPATLFRGSYGKITPTPRSAGAPRRR